MKTNQNPADYWNQRFSNEGRIWGDKPSNTAYYALKLFQKYDIKRILIPGAGYGRNSKLFSNNNFEVVGLEISEYAYKLALDYDSKTKFILGSVFEMPFNNDIYDAIYCYNTLHLFLKNNRFDFLEKCYNQLKNEGFVFFAVFSEKEKTFAKGMKLEKNTFESKLGRPTHYFSQEDLVAHFKNYFIIETGIIEEQENHGEIGPHTHNLRYIFAKKIEK